MKAEDVIEMFKDCYGYVKDIEGVLSYLEENEVSLTLSEEILYSIFDYNLRLQGKLETLLNKKNSSSSSQDDAHIELTDTSSTSNVTKTRLLDISTYRNSILACEDTDFITELLPSSFEKDYEDIIFSLLLSFYNDINEAFELSCEDDKEYWLNEIERYRTIINIIKEYFQESKEELEQSESFDADLGSKKNVIFLKNRKKEARIFPDILDIDISDYPYILTILNNIKNGEVKHIKKFYNHEELKHIYAIRQGDVRVYFANLSKDSVIILGAIAKRFQNSSSYSELLARISSRFMEQKEEVVSLLDDEDYLIENEDIFNQVTSFLNVQKKKIKESE